MAHIHSVYDSDSHFKIDPITRTITNMSSQKVTLVQYDHNSERFTFELPRQVEFHDMSTCNLVEVHYLNGENKDVYLVEDLQISPASEDVVTCSWLISQNATQFVGPLNFLVRFVCTTNGVIDYAWNTAIFSGINVSSGLNNSNTVAEDYSDILLQWKAEIDEKLAEVGTGGGGISEAEVEQRVSAAKSELIGTLEDTVDANTIRGAKAYANKRYEKALESTANKINNAKTELVGFLTDEETANTINGAKNYANKLFNSYALTEADKMEIAETVKEGIPLVKVAEQPEFVDSIDKMTDTSKVYVMPDGFLYAYMRKTTVTVGKNHFVPSEAIINARLSGSSGSITENGSLGSVVTGFIAVSDWNSTNPFEVSIGSVSNKGSDDNRVVFYDVNKTKLGYANIACSHDGTDTPNGVWENGVETYNIKVDKTGNAVTIKDVAYIRMQILVGTKETAITNSDVANLQIKFVHETSTTTQTGFFSTGQAYNQPADYEEDVVQLKRDVNSINEAIIELQNSVGNDSDSDEVSVPTYWQSAVDSCIAKIKALQVGRHCITFPFFSDNHTNTKDLGVLIAKVMKECNIPYCLFGGDAIDSGYLTESQMIGQDKTFDNAMSQIPNGRFCRAIGNHDGFWNDNGTKGYYTRAKVYELFLREEGLSQNKHFGEDGTYYYVNDIASKVRFIVLNTNSEVISAGGESIDSTQLSWLQNTALSFNEDGWGVVIISHCPISNHYHANVTNAAEVISAVNSADVDIIGWFSGHIHRDRMYTHLAVGSADGVEGTNGAALGFTQIVITSDHTGIAYDDTTKHSVANDDLSHAIDFVTINRNTRTVNLTRLGIGSDRSYTY